MSSDKAFLKLASGQKRNYKTTKLLKAISKTKYMSSKTQAIDTPYQFNQNCAYLNRSRIGGSPLSKITNRILTRKDYEDANVNYIRKQIFYKSQSIFKPKLRMQTIMDISAQRRNPYKIDATQLNERSRSPAL